MGLILVQGGGMTFVGVSCACANWSLFFWKKICSTKRAETAFQLRSSDLGLFVQERYMRSWRSK